MTNSFDIIIVGGGIFGAAIFFHILKRTQKKVMLLERSRFCSGATGSSGGFVRALHVSLEVTQLACHSISEYQNFEKITGHACDYHSTGFFTLCDRQNLLDYYQSMCLLEQNGLSIENVSPGHFKSNYSGQGFITENNDRILYEANAGYANPSLATNGYITAGNRLGGFASENIDVTDILNSNGKITGVKTSLGEFYASCVVLANGQGSQRILNDLGLNNYSLTTKAIQISFYQYPFHVKSMPSFIDRKYGIYGRNDEVNRLLVGKIDDVLINQNSENIKLCEHEIEEIESLAKNRMPWLDRGLWRAGKRAVDSFTAKKIGTVEFDRELQGLLVCTGWSGIGFKLAPGCAKQVVELLTNT